MKFVKGIGIIVGLMFGAGVFALPYAIARSGVLWGTFHFLITLFLSIFLLFLYAEITYYVGGKSRFTGYVGRILGKRFKTFSFLVVLGSYYSTLLAYGILGGIFLSNFLPSGVLTKESLSVLFFIAGSLLLVLKLGKVALANFYLTIPLFGFVFYLLYVALPHISLNNFPLTLDGLAAKGGWFLPYGVWLFSFGAMAAIPEARDIFASSPLRDFKKVIMISTLLCAFFYCLFVFSILGVSGLGTSKDALSGVEGILGRSVILVGSAMGFLAVFTSFLALGIDLKNVFYYEASRIMTLKNPGDVVHIHVTYVPTPTHLGEPKTKPAQLSVRTLNSMGIQPDFIIARSEKYLDQRRRDRFALFCNMHPEDIISNPDMKSAYEIPLMLHEQNLDRKILQKLHLSIKAPKLSEWEKFLKTVRDKKGRKIEIIIVGKYFGTGDYQLRDSYAALFDAIDHAAYNLNVKVNTRWVNAESLESAVAKAKTDKKDCNEALKEVFGKPQGVIVPIGWGERGSEGMIAAASYARKNKVPYLGLCYGMQLAVIAFARDVLGFKDANTTENDPKTKHPVIHLIPSQKALMKRRAYGGTMRLGGWEAKVKEKTRAYELYDKYDDFINKAKSLTSERHRHRYEFNDKYTKDFEKSGLIISARSVVENLVEIIELPNDKHPFYLGTQGHPEYKSRPLKPHPIFLGFIEACKNR